MVSASVDNCVTEHWANCHLFLFTRRPPREVQDINLVVLPTTVASLTAKGNAAGLLRFSFSCHDWLTHVVLHFIHTLGMRLFFTSDRKWKADTQSPLKGKLLNCIVKQILCWKICYPALKSRLEVWNWMPVTVAEKLCSCDASEIAWEMHILVCVAFGFSAIKIFAAVLMCDLTHFLCLGEILISFSLSFVTIDEAGNGPCWTWHTCVLPNNQRWLRHSIGSGNFLCIVGFLSRCAPVSLVTKYLSVQWQHMRDFWCITASLSWPRIWKWPFVNFCVCCMVVHCNLLLQSFEDAESRWNRAAPLRVFNDHKRKDVCGINTNCLSLLGNESWRLHWRWKLLVIKAVALFRPGTPFPWLRSCKL